MTRLKTSRQGWRVVAVGVLFLIFGITAISNNVGPTSLGLGLTVFAVLIMIIGRQL
jgi:hypothetical protein